MNEYIKFKELEIQGVLFEEEKGGAFPLCLRKDKNTSILFNKENLEKLEDIILESSYDEICDFLEKNNLEEIIYKPIKLGIFMKAKVGYTSIWQIHMKKNYILFHFYTTYEEWREKFTISNFYERLSSELEKKNCNLKKNLVNDQGIFLIFSNITSTITLKNLTYSLIKEIEKIFLDMQNKYEKTIFFKYEIDKNIKTGIKQYIVYFNEYVERTKGITINFEVENYSEGLVLKLNKNQNIERIGEYFEEYMNFLKYEKIEDIQPLYEINKNEYEKNQDKILLQNEIRELQYKYQTVQLLLETEKKHSLDYKNMINKMLNQNNINFNNHLPYVPNITLTLNNANTNSNTNIINISQQIETLQEDIEKIKEFFKELEMKEKEEELTEIDDEILEVSNAEDLKSKKKMFSKFKRIVNQINDENSTLNETIKATKKGKECLEKIKPYIPTILTTISNLGEYFK